MPTQKIAKNLPKRVTNDHAKATRHRSWNDSQARKVLRRKDNEARAAANRAAGKEPKRRIRPRSWSNPNYTRTCNRCNVRTIVVGTVCTCTPAGVL